MSKALNYHNQVPGKIGLALTTPLNNTTDLSLAYTPGVAEACRAIADNPDAVWDYTSRRNWVAVVSDGTAVLGLGDIGPEAGLPVMEGKAVLFKKFANVDAFPLCVRTKDVDEIVALVKQIAPSFGGINLEDISAPRCFEIEERLRAELDIPVFHDDQHGTAIVVLAGLINACRVTSRDLPGLRIVISGAGAAGVAIANVLLSQGVSQIIACDSQGIISQARAGLNQSKQRLLAVTNPDNVAGSLADALKGADVFIGVSAPNIVTQDMIRSMAKEPIIFAMANPVPEIMPDDARAAGAAIVATGRSDFPNQINNVLVFPGIFRGVLDARAPHITEKMKIAAAQAIADLVPKPTADFIIPGVFDPGVAEAVAAAVKKAV